ncbi:MAG: NAD(+) synthase, partial [Bacteroidales bacterium]|nr:NAD(+) synthase [Bacteroidales bacterium]
VAAVTPRVWLADPAKNAEEIISLACEAAAVGADIIVFPEMSVTGSTCGDLFKQSILLDAAQKAAESVAKALPSLDATVVIGLPVPSEEGFSSGAAIIKHGRFVGSDSRFLLVTGDRIPEDLPEGTSLVLHLAAAPELVTSHAVRKRTLAGLTYRTGAAYVYCAAGYGESTGDAVYAGPSLIYQKGRLLAENGRFKTESGIIYAALDPSAEAEEPSPAPEVQMPNPHPFVPADPDVLALRCEEILSIQVNGLRTRLEHVGCKTAVLGISGGLDSTLALLVTAATFDSLGYDRKGIIAVTMPGFGTSKRTHSNASDLMAALGVDAREIPIGAAVSQHFSDIGHDPDNHNVTFENAQARERTQILMDIANDTDGLVVGTGDLSEIALGWCTYNGDHMANCSVNADVPKTLMQAMVRWAAVNRFPEARKTLLDIVDTPISPELTPVDEHGNIKQKTEDIVGPYELHDFFLYHLVRHARRPREIRSLALEAFAGKYDEATVDRWLRKFLWRFFSQQFKRSCSPEGPRVGSVCLSPRGAWAAPSDVSAALWVSDLD